jgi:hypothetical protein
MAFLNEGLSMLLAVAMFAAVIGVVGLLLIWMRRFDAALAPISAERRQVPGSAGGSSLEHWYAR